MGLLREAPPSDNADSRPLCLDLQHDSSLLHSLEMNAQAEMDLDLADRTMGGYGVEEELERLHQKEKIREAKLAAKEGLGRDDVDETGNPPEGSLTLEEYIMPTVQNSINALGGWEVRSASLGFQLHPACPTRSPDPCSATRLLLAGGRRRSRQHLEGLSTRRQHRWLSQRHLQALAAGRGGRRADGRQDVRQNEPDGRVGDDHCRAE